MLGWGARKVGEERTELDEVADSTHDCDNVSWWSESRDSNGEQGGLTQETNTNSLGDLHEFTAISCRENHS